MIVRGLVFVCLVAAAGSSGAQVDEERGLKVH